MKAKTIINLALKALEQQPTNGNFSQNQAKMRANAKRKCRQWLKENNS